MQQTNPTTIAQSTTTTGSGWHLHARGHLRRFSVLYLMIGLVFALAVLPPLVNLSRFQRRIATSIGGSLGRPVHLDRVSLTVLPLPGFEIQNLVVDEDPAFGAEPIIRANTVRATLRLASLWRRRVEFSKISFTEPSLNLVHLADGRWNIEGVLLQASHIDAAPTAQRRAGATPRFPYIEATGARINFKEQQEKTPFSLIDSEFALWSADANEWRLRLKARPARTDSSASDTGLVELEGTLGRGDSLTRIPVNLDGLWHDAPLGEASRVLTGEDAGFRGTMTVHTIMRGTLGENAVTARLRLLGARRADFVPQQPLSAEVHCTMTAMDIFHRYDDLRCSWQPDASSNTALVALTGTLPDIYTPETAVLQIGASDVSAATALGWMKIASSRVSNRVVVTGKLSAGLHYDGDASRHWTGQMTLHGATVTANASDENDALFSGDLQMRLIPAPGQSSTSALLLSPTPIALGGRDPAILEGHFDAHGYNLRLSGTATQARLSQMAAAISPLGIGLAGTTAAAEANPGTDVSPEDTAPATGRTEPGVPSRIDLSSTAAWHEPHEWHDTATHPGPLAARRLR